MLRSALSKLLWVGWIASAVFGLALVVALVLGAGSAALAAVPGDPFLLGRLNAIDSRTTLAGEKPASPLLRVDNGSGAEGSSALDLRVELGRAPMTVNSPTRVENLNADLLDGQSAEQMGVNGLSQENENSPFDSDSPKSATAECPGSKDVVGTGYELLGATSGTSPNQQTDVVVNAVIPLEDSDSVFVSAVEEVPTSREWLIRATAICATAP